MKIYGTQRRARVSRAGAESKLDIDSNFEIKKWKTGD